MKLFPRFGRDDEPDPVKDEINSRKRALKDVRSRRRVGTPVSRDALTSAPADAVVFQRGAPADAVVFGRPASGDAVAFEPSAPEGAVVFRPGASPVEEPHPGAPQAEFADEPLSSPPDFLRNLEAPAEATIPAGDPLAEAPAPAATGMEGLAEAAAASPADVGGGDLLDLFREAKKESGAGNLASEVEDVSIDDLLSDLAGISRRLGVKHREPIVRVVPSEPIAEHHVASEIDAEPEVKVAKIVPPSPLVPPVVQVAEEVPELLHDIDIGDLIEPATDSQPHVVPPPAPEPGQPRVKQMGGPPHPRGVDGKTLLHVLFLGIALTAAGAFGVSRVHRNGATANAAPAGEFPAVVLAVVETPDATLPVAVSTKAPSTTPTPAPRVTSMPTFPPQTITTPKPKKTRNPSIPPAFTNYKVQYGDSLTSMAIDFGICPDHILWANNRDEDTPLMAGEHLTIPDGPGAIHTVEYGDTLQSIARLYNASVADIVGTPGNEVQTSDDLIPGDRIFVPNGIPQSALQLGSKAERKMSVPSAAGYVWPIYGAITTYYGEQRPGYVHRAIDIGELGHYGASVVAIADGTVVFVGDDSEYGSNVIVEHTDGTRSRYAHFSQIYVSQGQQVAQAQALGALGCSGDSTGTHLHFELWKDGKAVDPLPYLTPA